MFDLVALITVGYDMCNIYIYVQDKTCEEMRWRGGGGLCCLTSLMFHLYCGGHFYC